MHLEDSNQLLSSGAVVAPGIKLQIRQAGDSGLDARMLLEQQELKAKTREQNAEKALAKSHELRFIVASSNPLNYD